MQRDLIAHGHPAAVFSKSGVPLLWVFPYRDVEASERRKQTPPDSAITVPVSSQGPDGSREWCGNDLIEANQGLVGPGIEWVASDGNLKPCRAPRRYGELPRRVHPA